MYSALHYAGTLRTPLEALGLAAHATPLSIHGAGGCSGATLAGLSLSDPRVPKAVMRWRQGRWALAFWPFTLRDPAPENEDASSPPGPVTDGQPRPQPAARALPGRARYHSRRATAVGVADGGHETAAAIARSRTMEWGRPGHCRLCDPTGIRSTDDGPWHLLNECDNPLMRQAQTDIRAEAGTHLDRLAKAVLSAHEVAATQREYRLKATDAATGLMQAASTADWDAPDGRHTLFRLSCALPFPPAATRTPDAMPLTSALGSLFQATTVARRHARRTYNLLGMRAYRWIMRLADAWRRATASLPPEAHGGTDNHNRNCGSCNKAGGLTYFCSACALAFHETCALRVSAPKRRDGFWLCVGCEEERCPACGKGPVPASDSILCGDDKEGGGSGCDKAYHLRCVGLTTATLPEGDWLCDGCSGGWGDRDRGSPPDDPGATTRGLRAQSSTRRQP